MKGEFMQKKQKHKTKKRIKFPIAFMVGIAYANNGSGDRQNAHIRNKSTFRTR